MKHIIYQEAATYEVAVLIKSSSFNKQEIYTNYVSFIEKLTSCIVFDVIYENNKVSASLAKDYLNKLLPALKSLGTKYLYVADASYFKFLTKVPKVDSCFGYVLPCKIKGYEDLLCVLSINYQQLIFNPALETKIKQSIDTLAKHMQGNYVPVGSSIIHSESYPEGPRNVSEALNSLHQYPRLSCDIEGFSLRFWEAGIASIAFAWDEHNGMAFEVDCIKTKKQKQSVRYALKKFFKEYKGQLIFHKANYDIKALVYSLWMRDALDHVGMLEGLDILCKNVEDTLIVSYLAINSTAGNKLSLKELAQEFAGSYAVDVSDVTKVEKEKLLRYNLIDALCTQYVYKKNYPILVKDSQEKIYRELLIPALKVLIQTEMVGMPMKDDRIAALKKDLEEHREAALTKIKSSAEVKEATNVIQVLAMEKANAKLKTKQHPLSKFSHLEFNPNSGPQLQKLLYEIMGLPVLNKTDSGLPSTDGDTLKLLLNHCKPHQQELLNAFNDYSDAEKILSTFVPAFEGGLLKQDGNRYLHGSFNIGGTVSGRLSSSDPNLQNLPSNSVFGKAVKKAFVGNTEWILAGADFASLEDYISALTTKDKNKLAVYQQGFDGHCLRAAYYWGHAMPDIDPSNPVSVNSIKSKYPKYRQDSKAPTFLLTYGGTHHGLMKNCGFSKQEALIIEEKYHELYKESDEYVAKRLKAASKDGYVEVAFGLRVRTPMLKQVLWESDTIPYEAAAEGRTAGNALGQSYGLLNTRAANAFMERVWASEYRYKVLPVAQIHDAQYYLIKNDPEVIKWVNDNLIEEMEWQDLPEIQHPTVKLGAALDLFINGWHEPVTLSNKCSLDEIKRVLNV